MSPSFHETVAELDPSVQPGALQHHITRDLPGVGVLDFESAPAGWVAKNGERRSRDHRAYYLTAHGPCPAGCDEGREPGARPGTTRKCKTCGGTGQPKRRQLISVTTLIGQITPKAGLMPWAEARGIEGAVEAVRRGLIDPADEAADVVRVVRGAGLGADRARDQAADRGLDVHACLERYMLTGEPPRLQDHPVEHAGYVRALALWLDVVQPEPVSVEEVVCDPDAGYAGRYDLVAKVDGQVGLFDAKTSERGGIYDAAHLQLALRRRAMVASGDGMVDFGRVVLFAADGSWRMMDQAADDGLVDAAVDFAHRLGPVTALCERENRQARREQAERLAAGPASGRLPGRPPRQPRPVARHRRARPRPPRRHPSPRLALRGDGPPRAPR